MSCGWEGNRGSGVSHTGHASQLERFKLEFHGTDADTDSDIRDAPIV